MLRSLLKMALYLLKACVMFNMLQAKNVWIATGFATRKAAWFSLALLLLAAMLLITGLVFEDKLLAAYGSLLVSFLPVMLLDQLGTFYFRYRLRSLRKILSDDDHREYIA